MLASCANIVYILILNRFCTLCQQGVLGDEKNLLYECPALQDLRDRYENLFQAYQGDAMTLFMWQDDVIGVARVIDHAQKECYTSAGPPVGDQASDQPFKVCWLEKM